MIPVTLNMMDDWEGGSLEHTGKKDPLREQSIISTDTEVDNK